MAQQLYFSRDSQMFLEIGSAVWKIPVLEGFSFSQATNVSEITLNEMESTAGTSRRGRRAFNDSLAPVEFSFSTYIRPFKASGSATADNNAYHHAVEEALWALFSGPATYASNAFTNQSTHDGTNMDLLFSQSNKSSLGPTAGANLYFELGDANKLCYKLAKVVLNEASIDFDIDGVAQINWSGFADTITEFSSTVTVAGAVSSSTTVDFTAGSIDIVAADAGRRIAGTAAAPILADSFIASRTDADTIVLSAADSIAAGTVLTLLGPRATIFEATSATNNFIRNRLTKVFITESGGDPANALESTYVLTLTGGNITLSNNVQYLTPEELGVVNIPIGHVTGARSFGGSMTCYLSEDTATTNASKDFFQDLTSTAQRNQVTNKFSLSFLIGGGNAVDAPSSPGLQIKMPTCHVDIPTHSIEDIITLETTFMALPSTIDLADEVSMMYIGDTPNA